MVAQQDATETLFNESALFQMADSLLDMTTTTTGKAYVSVDTLHPGNCYIMPVPDDSLAKEPVDYDLLTLTRQTFFTGKDSLLPTDLPFHSYGVAGDPVPYTVRTDNMLTILLLFCFVLFIVSLAHSKNFLIRQLKDFFWQQYYDNDSETSSELRFMVFLSFVNVLVLAISSYLLVTDAIASSFNMQAGLALVGVIFAVFVCYYFLKWTVGSIVNMVFFGVKKNLLWMRLQLQVSALECVLLFPMLALQIYFDFSNENALFYIGVVLFLNKIITFYKSFIIFFQGNGLYLQTFLYFCALEIAPLLAFCGAGLAIIDLIKINF